MTYIKITKRIKNPDTSLKSSLVSVMCHADRDIHETKTHLSRLDRAAKGEPFIIAKAGKPLSKVVPLETSEQLSFASSASWPGRSRCPTISTGWARLRSNSV